MITVMEAEFTLLKDFSKNNVKKRAQANGSGIGTAVVD